VYACDVKVLTWNVWFGGHMFDERRDALIAELGRRRPEVIALQEVTPELHAHLMRAPWLPGYQISDEEGSTLGGYGVLLLARVPVKRFRWIDLPTQMGRCLLIGELASGLAVATVHLESTGMCAPDRAAQLAIIQPWLIRTGEDACLVGDMNFAPEDPLENAALDPSFVDVWPALRGDPGYTVDTDVNTMRFQIKDKVTRKRIDRVFLRSQRWRARAIELVGTAPIDVDGTFISDHFGLEVELATP